MHFKKTSVAISPALWSKLSFGDEAFILYSYFEQPLLEAFFKTSFARLAENFTRYLNENTSFLEANGIGSNKWSICQFWIECHEEEKKSLIKDYLRDEKLVKTSAACCLVAQTPKHPWRDLPQASKDYFQTCYGINENRWESLSRISQRALNRCWQSFQAFQTFTFSL